jgi:two-component system sensor histidine kinase PilS (NtrC family)
LSAAHIVWTSLWGLNRARLVTAAVVLAIGVLVQYPNALPLSFGRLAATVAVMTLACLLLPMGSTKITDPRRFARLQVTLDVMLVTGIVAASGGVRSIFVPLYVLAVVAACFLLSRAGAIVVAGLSSLLYLGLVLGPATLSLFGLVELDDTSGVQIVAVLLNAGVLLVVAIVIASLVDRYRQSQEHLDAERKHLSDIRAFHDLIFASVGSGLVAADPQGRVTAFNRAAESITGVSASEALGQPWAAIFGPGVDLTKVQQATADEGALAPRYEFQLRRRDGRELPVGISFWSLRSGRGDVAGLIGICQDLSGIKQMERRMRQADRLAAVGRLSANMAHEIRNPLASISGAVEALAKDLPRDPHRDRLVEIVLRESGRLNELVRDFLEYARPAPMAPLEVDMAQLLDDVLLLLEHRSLPVNLKIVREYGLTLPAHVDPQQIRQAIWNLCLNAVQAMPEEGGEIRVGGAVETDDADRLQLWITDTGLGIADDDLPHIFEPFYSTKPEGSGLGLALVYRVVQDHGGQIEVKSRLGEGTTFTLTLPAALEAVPPEPCPSTMRQP